MSAQEAMLAQAAPPRQVPPTQRGVPDMIEDLSVMVLELERSYAGYSCLLAALQGATGQVPAGERVRGLPIFKFPATCNGRDRIEVEADLRDIDPQHLPYVISPLANAQAVRMMQALEAGQRTLGELVATVSAALEPRKEAAA